VGWQKVDWSQALITSFLNILHLFWFTDSEQRENNSKRISQLFDEKEPGTASLFIAHVDDPIVAVVAVKRVSKFDDIVGQYVGVVIVTYVFQKLFE